MFLGLGIFFSSVKGKWDNTITVIVVYPSVYAYVHTYYIYINMLQRHDMFRSQRRSRWRRREIDKVNAERKPFFFFFFFLLDFILIIMFHVYAKLVLLLLVMDAIFSPISPTGVDGLTKR